MKKFSVIIILFIVLLFTACEKNQSTEPPDNNPVSISSPRNGSIVSGTVTVRASTNADYDMNRVIFYIDDDSVSTDLSSPYTYEWDTEIYQATSTHTIRARAYDDTSSYLSNTVTVTVTLPGANEFVYQASFSLTAPALRVAAEGGYLYLVMGTEGLQVLDYSTPASPVSIYRYVSAGTMRGVDAHSPYLVTAEYDNGIRSIQIKADQDTFYIGPLMSTAGRSWNVKIVGNLVFVADHDRLTIASINASNYSLSLVGVFVIPSISVKDVDVDTLNDIAYVLENERVSAYNISHPANPAYINQYTGFSGEGKAISVYGHRVFIATAENLTMLTDSLTFVTSVTQQSGYTGVYAIANVVFVSQGGSNGGARVFDYSDGSTLSEIDTYIIDESCDDITYADGYVFLAGQTKVDILRFTYAATY
jgi:hypothetical protein